MRPLRPVLSAGLLVCGLLAGAVLPAAAVLSSRPASAETFVLDRQHTEVRFSWDHLGLSRQSGRFLDVIGRVELDPDLPESSSVDVTIKVASLTTGVPELDRVLTATSDYFDVATHPNITFKSTAVAMTSPKTANVTGDLTINGITKQVVLSVSWNYLGEHPLAAVNPAFKGVTVAGFSARTQILRSEWGVSRMVPLVSDEIRITIETEMLKK